MKSLLVLLSVCLLTSFAHIAGAQTSVERVEKIESPEEVLKKFGDISEGFLHEGDRLTFMFKTDAVKANLTTMFGVPFDRQGRSGPYLGQVVIKDSDQLLMSYSFTENDANGWNSLKHYRAKNAPELPLSVTPLQGQHIKYEIESEHLDEMRRIEVYVPKVETDEPLPVVYLTDGRALNERVGAIDWKIRSGIIKPILVVGVHSGGYVGNRENLQIYDFDHRAQEYLAATGHERYEKHKKFFIEEVLPFVEKKHNASTKRNERALSGYSNGGACVTTMSVEHPEVFGNVFAYSVAFFDRDYLKEACAGKGQKLPNYRLAAGTLEGFIEGTRDAHEILDQASVKAEIRIFVAGHDPLMWQVALLEDIEAVFPASK